MHRYKFLPHTADIRMHVEASALQELFNAALEGMNSILYTDDIPASALRENYHVQLSSLDKTTLLIDFLSDILSASYERKMIFDRCNIVTLGDDMIEANLMGYSVERFDEDIKAVTYHEANVHQNAKGNWETVVIFDI